MMPGAAQKGDSSTSELFNSLKVYLNNKDRIQPFIGLSSIIECVKTGTLTTQVFYLCEVCSCRLSKADMRRHIMGSLHRYNYIKTWHPDFVSEWEGNPDLSKLAWPLMEIAKKIEEHEGTGHIQVLEFEEDLYQTLEMQSDDKAIALINSLRWHLTQREPDGDCDRLENASTPQQGTVLFSKSPRRQPERRADDNFKFFNAHRLYQASAENDSPLTQDTVYASFKQQYWSQSHNESQNVQTSPEPSDNSSFLDDYPGPKPLIGLENVVECKSEDGHTHCFLCHWCRVRANKYDIIDHLTCSSHLFNILMETHPEQVELLSADINDNYQLLQTLAMEVEHSEGRGELKVLKVPESLCSLMTGRSYHWCMKTLGLSNTDFKTNKMSIKGLGEIHNYDAGFPENQEPVGSKWVKKKKKKKSKDTVFKVTLPLVRGPLLVRRTSFRGDKQPVPPTYWPPADEGLHNSPQLEDFELDGYTNSNNFNYSEDTLMNANSQFQPYDHSGSTHQNIEHSVDDCFSDTDCIDPTKDLKIIVYEQRNAETQSCSSAYEVGHNAAQEKQNDEPSPIQVLLSSNSDRRAQRHRRWFQNRNMVQGHPSQFTARMGHHFRCGGQAPNVDDGRMNTYPHCGHPTEFPHIDQIPLHTYGYTALHFDHTQTHSTAYQGVTYDPNCSSRYGTPPQTEQY